MPGNDGVLSEPLLDELVRQGERSLGQQSLDRIESLRAVESILRLNVGALAGMIALAGVFMTIGAAIDAWLAVGFGSAVLLAVVAAALLAVPLAGGRSWAMVVGPDLRRALGEAEGRKADRRWLLGSLASTIPLWQDGNERALARIDRWRVVGMIILALAILLLLGTLAYMAEGAIP